MTLGREQTVLQNQKNQLHHHHESLMVMRSSLQEKEQQNVSGGFIKLYTDSIWGREQQVALLMTAISSQEGVVHNARLELGERVKERKIIDVLYDRDYAAFQAEVLKREQDESDEMAVLRYGGTS